MIQRDSDPHRVQELIRAEQAWLKAHLELDIVALDGLMADEYVQVNGRGALIHKPQILASFQNGTRHWDQAESDEYHVSIYGDIAIVIGRWRAKGVNASHAFDYTARYVSAWIYRHERWQMLTDQSTEVPTATTLNDR